MQLALHPDVQDNPARAVALESTLPLHGLPPEQAIELVHKFDSEIRALDAIPATCAVIDGTPTVGATPDQLETLIRSQQAGSVEIQKVNTSNLGLAIHQQRTAATTVSTTMELAAAAGVQVFATGGIGGVHRNFSTHLDISADLTALTRWPVAVVSAGVKSILDIDATREALETLGVPVLGYQTEDFPAFYLRATPGPDPITVDQAFADEVSLSRFIRAELTRSARGVLVANPIPRESELDSDELAAWTSEAETLASKAGVTARNWTPAILAHLHRLSAGRTVAANTELALNNVRLAARIAAHDHT